MRVLDRRAPRPCDARPRGRGGRAVFAALGLVAASSCASVHFERDTDATGTFSSSALAFTLLSYDFPAPALSIARGNAADSGLNELAVESELVFPYLWRLDWLLDIVSIRYARVSGTWGVRDDGRGDEPAR